MTPEELVGQALAAMKFAYVPYSGFTVGAALLTKSGSLPPLLSLEARTAMPPIFSRPAASAGRSCRNSASPVL